MSATTSSTVTKLCKDCKHHRAPTNSYVEALCASPHLGTNLVTGTNNVGICRIQRMTEIPFEDHFCGPKGKYWEPK